MTFETFFQQLMDNRTIVVAVVLALPWLAWLICYAIPGRREEPFVLSVNLTFAVISLLMWAGYLAYATNQGGWARVVKEADLLLLLAPIYYVIASLWISAKRMPLAQIPAFRTLQGIGVIAGVFLVISWLSHRVYIVFFTYMPFSSFLVLLAILLGIAYMGYERIIGKDGRSPGA
jgi:hypothetical protein